MNTLLDDAPAEALEDAYEIDYAILPEAPAPSREKRSLWEIFLLGWETFTPKFPARSDVTIVRRRK